VLRPQCRGLSLDFCERLTDRWQRPSAILNLGHRAPCRIGVDGAGRCPHGRTRGTAGRKAEIVRFSQRDEEGDNG